jgi:predicted MFS family arabinose efflux permease
LALALGLQVATARLGTAAAFVLCPMLPEWFDFQISAPVMVGLAIMCIGLITFLVFCIMDARLDKEESESNVEQEEPFRVSDIVSIIKVPAFWYIAILCLVFYSAVFPFLKNATDFMFNKYPIDFAYASWIPAMLPFGTILLTPIFGGIYDKVGRGATLMLIGSVLLFFVHVVFAMPQITSVAVAIAMMIVLGIAFSLVPSAMWPAVTKIVEPKKLGSAYALIFWLQNVGLMGVPLLINWVLNEYCIVGTQVLDGATINKYDYTTPMVIFAVLSFSAILFALLLKREDKRKGYGIEEKK